MKLDNTLTYKGYFGSAEYSINDKVIHGKILGLNDSVTYEIKETEDIQKIFEETVDEYLDDCILLNREPNRIPSGKFSLRIASKLHKALEIEKELTGLSINKIAENSLWERYSENDLFSSDWKFEELNKKVSISKHQLKNIFIPKEEQISNFSVGVVFKKEYLNANSCIG